MPSIAYKPNIFGESFNLELVAKILFFMEIICINSVFNSQQKAVIPNRPKKDKLYTIRDIFTTREGKLAVHLMEIENPKIMDTPSGMYFEPSFNANRFRTLGGDILTRDMNKKTELI